MRRKLSLKHSVVIHADHTVRLPITRIVPTRVVSQVFLLLLLLLFSLLLNQVGHITQP